MAAVTGALLGIQSAGKKAAAQVTKPISTATSIAVKADAVTLGTAITGYYAGGTGALTLATAGLSWTLTASDGSVVQSGRFSEAGETVTSSSLSGPGAWCVGIAPLGNAALGWHYGASGGVLKGGTCP